VQVVFLSNPYEMNNTKLVLIEFIQAIFYVTNYVKLFSIIKECTISKITEDLVEYCYFFRKAFTRFDFTGDCQ